ncbi:MAG: hypothetical protein IT298_05890 [Chloroflexi bacterium]|jgi:hypothetical protein|nr:MAG: hypothetical protein UZ13_03366 [Chloroflexi bacterium OLB13]MBC6957098.1 hypothetical protein [Chloroflexota bacterium]MBV6436558.1 hypothetical protein [Anaerolineae bacterium]MDL1916069.1 hypothetical protein [Anaerolineae bacterium CFX4]OQY82989.1 MAG: hypothetical protein B6D42_08430 [Anaerolineae bacterium UTCFX5]
MAEQIVQGVFAEVAEFLARRPSDDEILAYHAPEHIQRRASELLEANRSRRLTDAENAELDEYEHMDHFVAMLKAKTRIRMQGK